MCATLAEHVDGRREEYSSRRRSRGRQYVGVANVSQETPPRLTAYLGNQLALLIMVIEESIVLDVRSDKC